ncbi:hypothetical protein ACFYZJ_31210 [Streptomyces sp. NPDC001848]
MSVYELFGEPVVRSWRAAADPEPDELHDGTHGLTPVPGTPTAP